MYVFFFKLLRFMDPTVDTTLIGSIYPDVSLIFMSFWQLIFRYTTIIMWSTLILMVPTIHGGFLNQVNSSIILTESLTIGLWKSTVSRLVIGRFVVLRSFHWSILKIASTLNWRSNKILVFGTQNSNFKRESRRRDANLM